MDAPAPTKPTRRWHQRRLPRYVAVLVVASVGAYFAWDALFMPADLRRLQGNWKVVRILTDGEEVAREFERLVVTSRRLEVESGDSVRTAPFYIVSQKRELCVYEQDETNILGIAVRLPVWLKRPQTVATLQYEFGDNLVLRMLPGEGQRRTEIFLERME